MRFGEGRSGAPIREGSGVMMVYVAVVVLSKDTANEQTLPVGEFATEAEADGRVRCAIEWLGAAFGYIARDGKPIHYYGRSSSLRPA